VEGTSFFSSCFLGNPEFPSAFVYLLTLISFLFIYHILSLDAPTAILPSFKLQFFLSLGAVARLLPLLLSVFTMHAF
jgi:hypothetical protein